MHIFHKWKVVRLKRWETMELTDFFERCSKCGQLRCHIKNGWFYEEDLLNTQTNE